VGISYNNTQGVMKKSSRDVLNGNIRLSYRVKDLSFSNQTMIGKTKAVNNPDGNAPLPTSTSDIVNYHVRGNRSKNGTRFENYSLSFSNQTMIGKTKAVNNPVDFSAYSQMNPFYAKRTVDGDGNRSKNGTRFENYSLHSKYPSHSYLLAGNPTKDSKHNHKRFRSPNETFFAKTDADKKGTYTKNSSSNNSITGRLNLTFGRSFGDHTVNGVAGMQFSDKNQESYNAYCKHNSR